MDPKMRDAETRELRKFFLRLALPLLGAGAVALRHHWRLYLVWAAFWICVLGLALLFPARFRPLRNVLRAIGKRIGIAVTATILAVVYFLVLVPLGLLAKLFGHRFLLLKPDEKSASYWVKRDNPKSDARSYERQY